jgi:hypothetical protein
MKSTQIAAIFAASLFASTASATILTFDVAGGVTNFANINQTYGDNVSASPDGAGHSYGVGAEGFTPNVTVEYGTPGEDPALWTTGYGDLTNIHFNDADGDTTFTVRFTADSGYQVTLFDFDIASFLSGGQTIAGLEVRNGTTNAVLFSLGSTFITGATHLQIAPNVSANDLILEIDVSGLGGASDDIGIDNVRFGQAQVVNVPEAGSLALLGGAFAALGLVARRRRNA